MTAIARLLLPILRLAGRWLIRRVIRHGAKRILARIEARIEEFHDRILDLRDDRRRAKTKAWTRRCDRRIRWLQFRIRWRTRVVQFIARHQGKLTTESLRLADQQYDRLSERIPERPPRDAWDAWRKAA